MIDKTVKSVQHTPRRVPVSQRGEVKAGTWEKGIIKKVTFPTEWIGSMVVAKPARWESTEIFKTYAKPWNDSSTKRSPSTKCWKEDIPPQLAKAGVFSTLDAKDGFYRISFDEESSMKTACWTFGRCQYLRVLFGVSLAPEEFECKLHNTWDDLLGVVFLRDTEKVKNKSHKRPCQQLHPTSPKSKRNYLRLNNFSN